MRTTPRLVPTARKAPRCVHATEQTGRSSSSAHSASTCTRRRLVGFLQTSNAMAPDAACCLECSWWEPAIIYTGCSPLSPQRLCTTGRVLPLTPRRKPAVRTHSGGKSPAPAACDQFRRAMLWYDIACPLACSHTSVAMRVRRCAHRPLGLKHAQAASSCPPCQASQTSRCSGT